MTRSSLAVLTLIAALTATVDANRFQNAVRHVRRHLHRYENHGDAGDWVRLVVERMCLNVTYYYSIPMFTDCRVPATAVPADTSTSSD